MARPATACALLILLIIAPAAGAAWPGGNGRIVFSSGGDLWNGDRRLTATPGEEAQGTWAPNGGRLAFRAGTTPYRIATMNADGRERVLLPGSELHESQPAWSPDGARIVYRRSIPGNDASGDIWLMNADGSGKIPLLADPADERYPAFSPDGTRIVFTRGDDIWVANSDGGLPRAITSSPSKDSAPSWAPSSRRIAFERGPATDHPGNEIWTMSPDGGQERQLTSNGYLDEGPAWSPRGDLIAFTSGDGPQARIHTMAPDGAGNARVQGLPEARHESPDWQPVPPRADPLAPGFPETQTLPPAPPESPDPDGDRDGVRASIERLNGSSDVDVDSDDDGLSDGRERRVGTSAARRDSDRDGLLDGVELGVRRPIADPPGAAKGTSRRRFRRDRDPRTRTSPVRRDTDRDGVVDGREDRNRNGRVDRGERDPRRRGR